MYLFFYNWDTKSINQAFQNCKIMSYTPSGFSQSLTQNYTNTQESETDTEISFHASLYETNLYCHLMSYVSDIAKYSIHDDHLMKDYLSKTMLTMVKNTILRRENKLTNEQIRNMTIDDFNSNPNQHEVTITQEVTRNELNDDHTSQYINIFPKIDKRTQDSRIKYNFEN